MQLELLRLSLLERRQLDVFAELGPDGREWTREGCIRHVFSARIDFTHRTEAFCYVPERNDPARPAVLVGRIGRRISIEENEPPEQGLSEIRRDAWRAAVVLIDPRYHEDGQKVALERNNRVGRPISLFDSLVEQVNRENIYLPYVFEASAIVDAPTFWDFVREHKQQITTVEFEFIAPNMFGPEDDYHEELTAMRDTEKVRKARLKLENPDGLELETNKVKAAVNYTSRGGGAVRARARNGQKFNSKDKVKRLSIKEDRKDPPSILALIKQATALIFGL